MTYRLAGGSRPLVAGTGRWAGTRAAVPPTTTTQNEGETKQK